MNTTAHPVAPEEVMALLDGELSEVEARDVSAHLDECAECAGLAAQFRGTSQQLAGWSVPPVPARIEAAVMERATAAGARRKTLHRGNWYWLRWTLGGGGAVAALLVLLFVGRSRDTREFRRNEQALPMVALESRESRADSAMNDVAALKMESRSRAASPVVSRAGIAGGKLNNESLVDKQLTVTPMIARTVSLTLRVKDVATSRPFLEAMLARHHGYTAQMNANTVEGGPLAFTASLRIPAAELAGALNDFRTLGKVENESQSGEEVTEQHEDLVARLKTARETEVRFQTILQQRTGSISDVLEVEEGIARVRGEIESMEAEQSTLEHRVDFASVDVSLTELYKAQLSSPGDAVSTRLHNAFVAGYRNAWETLLGIVLFFEEYGPALLIWLVILGLPSVLVWRRYRLMLRSKMMG